MDGQVVATVESITTATTTPTTTSTTTDQGDVVTEYYYETDDELRYVLHHYFDTPLCETKTMTLYPIEKSSSESMVRYVKK
jgi:hypothetical protein